MKKKIIKKLPTKTAKKAVKATEKVMPITGKTSVKKVYPENKRTRVVDSAFLGKDKGVPNKLSKKNSTNNLTK